MYMPHHILEKEHGGKMHCQHHLVFYRMSLSTLISEDCASLMTGQLFLDVEVIELAKMSRMMEASG